MLFDCAQSGVLTPLYSATPKCRLSLFAIDEAHCISSWGHDFRHAYRSLGEMRSKFPDVPVIAVTATATPRVQDDIVHSLRLRSPDIFNHGFDRPNLFYEVRYKENMESVALDMWTAISTLGGNPVVPTRVPVPVASGFVSARVVLATEEGKREPRPAAPLLAAPVTPCGVIYAPTRQRVQDLAQELKNRGYALPY